MSGIDAFASPHSSDASSAASPASSSSSSLSYADRRTSIHTAAALDMVDGRRSLRPPHATRSVDYSAITATPLPVYPRPQSGRPGSARPKTAASAAALAGVVPTDGDRLKHLQLHMEQLQQLYAHEIHKEELARREVFVQSMCTASITLWRYVCSKPRFFTAVKALVTQYLPASDARLYEVEATVDEDNKTSGYTLVLADGRTVAVSEGTVGVVGLAVQSASQLSSTQWTKLQAKLAEVHGAGEGGVDNGQGLAASASSMSSSAKSSSKWGDDATLWLERHNDCILPSTNEHVFVVLPLHRVYQDAGFNPEIDLTIKKRDLFEGSTTKQLLVVVLRDTNRRPVGAFEALVNTKKPLRVDFLDAFASLLAAALDARRSICRPSTGAGLSVQIIHDQDIGHQGSPSMPSKESDLSGLLALEIAPGIKMVVAGGGSAQSAENDLPLLEAVQKPMAELLAQQQHWQQHAVFVEERASTERTFWTTVVMLAMRAVSKEADDDDLGEYTLRGGLRNAVDQISDPFVRFSVLFEDETIEQFAASTTSKPEATSLSVEGQFAAMEQSIRTGEMFTSTPFVTAIPVTASERKAAILVLVESNGGAENQQWIDYSTSFTVPLVKKAIELVLWTEHVEEDRAAARVEAEVLVDALQQAELRSCEIDMVLNFSQRLALCESIEEIVEQVHSLKKSEHVETRFVDATLFVADYRGAKDATDITEASQIQSIWTVCSDGAGRVVVYEPKNVVSPRRDMAASPTRRGGGMAAFVIESGAPLMYTPQHVAFDPSLRKKLHSNKGGCRSDSGHCFYYAFPLCVHATSLVHGVLEFLFTSEEAQKAFAESAFAVSIGTTLERFLELHHWMSTTQQQNAREAADAEMKTQEVWTRYQAFVRVLCDSTEIGIDSWKALAESQFRKLVSRPHHVNVLVRAKAYGSNGSEGGDDELINTISRELEASGHRQSPSLNVYNHTVLHNVTTYPLGDLGMLVVANETNGNKSGPDLDKEDDMVIGQFGQIATHLLTYSLNHISTTWKTLEEERSLRKSLVAAQEILSNEQDAHASLSRRMVQRSTILRVYDMLAALPGVISENEVMNEIIRVVTACTAGNVSGLFVGILMPRDKDHEWVALTDHSKAEISLSANASRFVAVCDKTSSHSSPLSSNLVELKAQLWPREIITTGCQVVITPLQENWYTSSQSGRLVLFENPLDPFVDDTFTSELASSIDRVIARCNQIQNLQNLHAELDHVQTSLELNRRESQAAMKSRDRWADTQRRVSGRLWAMRRLASGTQEADLLAGQDELLQIIKTHVQSEIDAVCGGGDHPDESQVQVKVCLGTGDGLLEDAVVEWMRSDELVSFLEGSRQQRVGIDTSDFVEVYGGVVERVLAAKWSSGDSESSHSVAIVAVYLGDRVESISVTSSIGTFAEVVMIQALDLFITVENVLALFRRAHEDSKETARLTQLLEERTAQVARTTEDSARRSRVDQVVSTLMTTEESVAFHSNIFAAIHQLPGFCLWIKEDDEETLWTTHADGMKRTRAYNPSTWQASSRVVEIVVDGQCLSILEAIDAIAVSSEELKLVASVVHGAFQRHHLRQTLDDLKTQTATRLYKAAEISEQQCTRRGEILCHWHRMDALLDFAPFGMDATSDEEPCQQTQTRVENETVEAFPEVEAMRTVFVDIDVKHHCVVDYDATNGLPDACHRLANLLDLWSMDATCLPRTKLVSTSEHAAVRTVSQLLAREPHNNATFIVMAVPTRTAPSQCESHRSFAVLVALASFVVGEPCVDVLRALELDLRLIATASSRSRELAAMRRRAMEAEMARVALTTQHDEAQQWIAFMETTQQQAERLVRATVEATREPSCANMWDVVAPQVEVFVRTACACDGVELYDVVADNDGGNGLLVPLTTSGASLSPSARSREFANSLDRLVNGCGERESATPRLETSPSGKRLVCVIHGMKSERAVGVLVVHWNGSTMVSDPVADIVDSLVRPWLTTVFTIVHDSESQRVSQDASTLQIQSLAREKSELEMKAIETTSRLVQAEQRNAMLQSTVQVASELLEQLKKGISSVAATQSPATLWSSLVDAISGIEGVHGVQLYDTDVAHEPLMANSTLSNAEDAVLLKAVGSQESGGTMWRCLPSREPQELRVLIQSEYKRVRLVSLPSDHDHSKCLVVVFASDKQISHQQLSLLDQFIVGWAALAAHRVVEMERTEVQAEAANALEAAAHDLTIRLKASNDALERAQDGLKWWEVLNGQLSQDLQAHEVWKSIEKTTQDASMTIPTAKLTAMWRFLQGNVLQRLHRGLAGSGTSVSLQLYGLLASEDSKDGFVFSLPTQANATNHRPVPKGFYCVALGQLEQRREWRKMVQCIRSGNQVPQGNALVDGTMLFPVRRCPTATATTKTPLNELEIGQYDCEADDADDAIVRNPPGEVVGVLLVKLKNSGGASKIEFAGLVQDVADAMASRIAWIGKVVYRKQRAETQAKTPRIAHGGQDLVSNSDQGYQTPSHTSVYRQARVDAPSSDLDPSATSDRGEVLKYARYDSRPSPTDLHYKPGEPYTESNLTGNTGVTHTNLPSNQDAHERPADADEDADSDEERSAERARDRMRVAITTGVLDFVLRVQALHTFEPDDDDDVQRPSIDSLRWLVARELKHVWVDHGDTRKHLLSACELFFWDGSVVRDALDLTPATTSTACSAPPWVVDAAARLWAGASSSEASFRLWKVAASRWIVAHGIESSSARVIVLVALSGSSPLSSVFDTEDEQRHLPSLTRALAAYATEWMRAQSRRVKRLERESQEANAAAQRDTEWGRQCHELARRSQLEEELSVVAIRLLRTTDARALIQTTLEMMQRLLGCDQVAFHATSSADARTRTHVEPTMETESPLTVAMETVIRVNVMASGSGDDTDRELLGTMVARLSEETLTRINTSLPLDTKGWTMRMLQRLADDMAIALTASRQRGLLHQAEATLASASHELESHANELLTLQDENAALRDQVDSLSAVRDRTQAVERANAALHAQLEQLRDALAVSDEARASMAVQLRQCETQLLEVNNQLEQSARTETRLLRLEDAHTALQVRATRLEKKVLKHKLQRAQLVDELTTRRATSERDQAELLELRRHVAVLTEKQQHQTGGGSMDASSVAAAVMQAQAQAMAQTHAMQQHQSHVELKHHAQQQRARSALQRRLVRHLQLQQHAQKRKQLDLALELRQLAALEVEEMARRSSPGRAKRHEVSPATVATTTTRRGAGESMAKPHQTSVPGAASRPRSPRGAIADRMWATPSPANL